MRSFPETAASGYGVNSRDPRNDWFQNLADGAVRFQFVAHMALHVNRVGVAAADPLTLQEARFLKFGDDSLYGPFRDPDRERHLPQALVRV
ncbi:MAG: hypothetical protein RL648_1216 [Verrucomicrobiota bacterium]